MPLTTFKQAGTTRESLNIWADCPQERLNDNRTGFYYFNDFRGVAHNTDGSGDLMVSGMHFYGTNPDVSRLDAVATGVLDLATSGGGDDHANIALEPEAQIVLNSGKKIWFEARIAALATSATTAIVVAIGEEPFQLIGAAGPIAAGTTALTTESAVGFRLVDTDVADMDAFVMKDGSETIVGTEPAQLIVAGTYYNLGFKFDGATTLEFYVDGDLHFNYTVTAATVALATAMGPVVGIKESGGNARSVYIDWFRWGYDFQ